MEQRIVLDVGCGTGIYDVKLAKYYDHIYAIDMSRDMIEYAQNNNQSANVSYKLHNICEKPTDEKADVVVSLSHVIGYQTSNDRLRSFVENISKSMKDNALFVFSFYNSPAILRSELNDKEVSFSKDWVLITRHSSASPSLMENSLINRYDYTIIDQDELRIHIEEKMRYFSVQELEEYLYVNGLEILETKNYLSQDELDEKEWNGCIVARKSK